MQERRTRKKPGSFYNRQMGGRNLRGEVDILRTNSYRGQDCHGQKFTGGRSVMEPICHATQGPG